MKLDSGGLIVFYGDSITDCNRSREQADDLGDGYVKRVADRLPERFPGRNLRIVNKGISGNRIYDLEGRLATDVLPLKPALVSILIGINDTWRAFDSGIASPAPEFQASYRRVIARILESGSKVLLMEPFLLPIPDDRRAWRTDLDARIAATRELAWEFHLDYIPLDGIFAAAAAATGHAHWLPDGVHPSPAGHDLIAEHWLNSLEG